MTMYRMQISAKQTHTISTHTAQIHRQIFVTGPPPLSLQPPHEVQRRLLLDVVVRQSAAILQLLAGKDQSL